VAKQPPQKAAPRKSPPSQFEDPFAAELNKRVSAIVGRDQASKVTAQILSLYHEERFQGPIAHPKHLREYEEIVPGSGDRIIKMAEGALEHQKEMQKQALDADIQDTQDGRRYGFWALIALIVAALACGLTGHEILAGLFLGTGALGTVGAFIRGKVGTSSSNSG